ncbi:MAG: metallophosphoesterase [Clostridia bacterium]|nr:metallophosphoesterase [Clostridia bacterium]
MDVITSTITLVISFILAIGQVLSPVGALIKAGGEDAFFTEWSATDEFGADDYIELKKEPGKDFVILNLADLQLQDDEIYAKAGKYTFELVEKLVEDTDPDLITLTGDNAWDTMSYLETIKLVDSFGIPWAPVMGNHDGQGCISEFWAAYHISESENSVFEFGPADMGYGNYIVNVTENGRIVHTVFFMDTHNNRDYTLEDGTVVGGYDHLWENQMAWYEWAVKGIAKLANHTVPSTVFMHIPVVEYLDAWVKYMDGPYEFGTIDNKYYPIASGSKFEVGGFPCHEAGDGTVTLFNNGFFSLCQRLGSTKDIIVGHDHVNDFSILHEGIRLTYAVKTGFGSYWQPEFIGGTTVNINTFGIATITQHYYDLAENGWDITDD